MDALHTNLSQIAQRHGVSEAVAHELLEGLRRTGGRQVQFDFSELGGMGQWMPGMVMVGRMGDNALKARVDALCTDLSTLAVAHPVPSPSPVLSAPEHWWPDSLGIPSSVGAQNEIAYAHFADANRFAIRQAGVVTLYDTTGYVVHGVGAQQQSGAPGTLTLTTDRGPVPLERLPVAK